MKAREKYSTPASIEVIVVDNCSTDKTDAIAQSFGASVVTEEDRKIATARNSGARTAQGKILGFLDADSCITPNMFNSIAAAMASGEFAGGGTMIRFERNSPGLFCTYCVTVIPARWLLGIMCGLIFTEKQTFEELGGFDESLYCAEDSKFALALKKLGRKTGRKFKIIASDYVVTSTRTFDRLGDWYYFKNIPVVLLKGGAGAFRNRELVKKFWYEIER